MKEQLFKTANRLANFNTPEEEMVDDFTDSNNNYNMMVDEALKNSDTRTDLDIKNEVLEEQCRNYIFRTFEPKLPISEKKEEIVKFIQTYDYSIIEG